MLHTSRKIVFAATLMLPVGAAGAEGFNDSFHARSGDLNTDGLPDLYVYSDAFETPAAFVLQQSPDRTFNLILNLNADQRATLSEWPELDISLRAADVDLDFNDDLVFQGLRQQPGFGSDLIVYANGAATPRPVGLVIVDEAFTGFFRQLLPLMENPRLLEPQITRLPACDFTPQVEGDSISYVDQGDEVFFRLPAGLNGSAESCYRYAVTADQPFNPNAIVVAYALQGMLAEGASREDKLVTGGVLYLLSNPVFLDLIESQ